MEYEKLGETLRQYSHIYLYGAGIVAYGASKAIRELFGITIEGFLVTAHKGQMNSIEQIPVCELGEIQAPIQDSLILIATPEEYHSEIEQLLAEKQVPHYISLDSHTEYSLTGAYLKKAENLSLIEDYQAICTVNDDNNTGVYMAVSCNDKKLSKHYTERPWVKKIQVGAALTDQRIEKLCDNYGDNISYRNPIYGELTAAYYAWKHSTFEVTGIFHYRRIMNLGKKHLGLLKDGTVDVILPLPFVCYPDASGQYGRYLLEPDIEVMLQVMREREGGGFMELSKLLKKPYLYNYNMLVARKEVFDDYCGWMFPLLNEIEYRCEKEVRNRLPRYIGRVGEVLTSLYFMRNTREWNITHAEKVWRV